MRDFCEFENGKLGALGRMQVSGWILIINQNDFLDNGQIPWKSPHGKVPMEIMEKSSWKSPHGKVLMEKSSWKSPVLMEKSSWKSPHGQTTDL